MTTTPRTLRRPRRRGAAMPPRRAVALALAGALLTPVVSSGVAAAGPASGPMVLGTDRDAAPGGELVSTTYGLDRNPSGSRSSTAHRPGWTVEVAVPAGTQQVGLVWSGDPRSEFRIRTRATETWSAPTDLTGQDGPDDDRGRQGAGPLWLGARGVSAVQVTLTRGLAADVRLEAMTFRGASGADGMGTRAASASIVPPATPAGGPPIYVRSGWAPAGWASTNPDCQAGPKANKTFSHVIVHHTASSNAYAQADVPGILAGIYRFHTGARGWCDIAYNLLIDRFGRVWEGRSGGIDDAIAGGHAQGFNGVSVGVALLGQFQPGASPAAAQPAAAMMTALRDVLAWKVGSQGLDARGSASTTSSGNPKLPAGTVVNLPVINGHRDTAYTSCPGEYVYRRLPQLRVDVAKRITASNDAARWRPHQTGARYWSQMFVDAEGSITVQSRIGFYTSAVVRGGWPQGDLTASVVLSPTTAGRIGLVYRLYRTAFGRNPDTGGLTVNVGHRDRGMAARDLAGNFLKSAEFKQRYGTPDDAAFTQLLFRNALGRDADQASLDAWGTRLADGLPRQDMLVHFVNSAEHKARTDVPERVTTAFFVMLRRVPSPASLAYWEPRLRSGTTNQDLVVALLRNQEYLARFGG